MGLTVNKGLYERYNAVLEMFRSAEEMERVHGRSSIKTVEAFERANKLRTKVGDEILQCHKEHER